MSKLRPLDEMINILIGALALLLGVGAVYLNWQKAQHAELLAVQSRQAVGLLRQLQISLSDAESAHRGYLVAGSGTFLTDYTSAMGAVEFRIGQLRETAHRIGPIGARMAEIERLVTEKETEMKTSLQAAYAGEWEVANEFMRQGRQIGAVDRLRARVAETEQATIAQGDRLAIETQDKMRWAAILAVGACVALFVLFAIDNQRAAARRRAVEHVSAVKSAFLASMSHELRTPLNAVIGYSQMLQEEAEADGRKTDLQDLQKIETAGKHLLELINAILEMSKIDAGKVEISSTGFRLHELLDEVIELVRPMAEKNGNTLELAVAPGVSRMHSDATKVRQCLLNLLSNAAKFTQNGTIKLGVERVLEINRPYLRFAVSDSGPGIPQAELALLFEPFHQLESTPVRGKGQGTGLGLAITRRLSRMMSGDTFVESELGKGTTFTLALPEEMTPGALAAAKAASKPANPVVLVIDDDDAIHDLVRKLLDRQPLEVVTARSGDEGLRIARELKPRVITLDIVMDGADGWEILRRLKNDADLASIPVVLLSILDTKGDPRGFMAADVLTKPVDVDTLGSAILRLAAAGRTQSALIVDDNEESRSMLRKPLEKMGWEIHEAAGGADALEMCAALKPGLVLLDLMMPEVDGFEFLSRLRSSESGRDTPVLVVTAMDLTTQQRERLRQQAAAVVSKSVLRGNELIAQVLAALK